MTQNVSTRFRRIHRKVQQFLAKHQFMARGQTFWRPKCGLSQVIVLRRSRWNTADDCLFWFTIGIFVPGFSSLFWETQEPLHPKEGFLTISLGIDNIPGHPATTETLMWQLKTDDLLPSKDDQVVQQVLGELEVYTIPFLARFQKIQDAIEFLDWLHTHRGENTKWNQIQPNDVWIPVYKALLHWLQGDADICFRTLEALLREDRTGYFLDKVERIRERLQRQLLSNSSQSG